MRKVRYALEAMGKPIDSMKPLQDALGAAHDLELLQVFTEKNLKLKAKQHSISRKAVRLAKPAIHFAVSKLRMH
jgi:CHAD domain-containing protein